MVYLKEHPVLDTPEFRKAWADWNTYRREAKKKLTNSTAKVQLKNLAAVGSVSAIQAIENSIGHGWQGLVPKGSTGNTSNTPSNGDGFPAQREPTSEEADELLKGLDGFGTTAGGARA